ncbi:MAG: hypothetical protein KKD99_04075 [Proteobacteria bacterium]|nr:hypothetical protein [Pseudomonadota bacterium]MBU4447744.1 hypothetical protein [Pseudomonadota bacterium]
MKKLIIISLVVMVFATGCAHTGITVNESVEIENGVIARFILFERVTLSGPSARSMYCFTTDKTLTQLTDVRSFGSNGPIDSLMGKVVPAAAIAGGVGGIGIATSIAAKSVSNAINNTATSAVGSAASSGLALR